MIWSFFVVRWHWWQPTPLCTLVAHALLAASCTWHIIQELGSFSKYSFILYPVSPIATINMNAIITRIILVLGEMTSVNHVMTFSSKLNGLNILNILNI